MRTMKRQLTTTMALALVGLTGCGTAVGISSAEGQVDTAQVERQAAALYDRITGTGPQREAGHYLQYQGANDAFWACLREHDQQPSSRFVPIWTGYVSSPLYGLWLAPLGQAPSNVALARRTVATADAEAEAAAASDMDSAAYRKAARTCVAITPTVDPADLPGKPDGAEELTGTYTELIAGIDARLGPIEDYRQCLAAAGVELADGEEQGHPALEATLTRLMPTPPAPGEEPSAEWQDYLDLEAEALAADSSCRREQYERGLALLAPELEEFESTHAAEIERVAAGWEELESTAANRGLNASD